MKNENKGKIKSYQNGLLLMLFFTYGFVFMDRLSITFLFPFIKEDLGLSNTLLGLLAAVLAVCYGISGWVFSSIGDIIGVKKKILVSITVIFSLFSIVSGLARSFVMLFIVRGLMGVFEGPVFPIGQSFLAYESTPERRGFNLGFAQSAVGLIGAALTPLIVTSIATATNWHVSFYIVAIPGIIMAFLLAKFLKDPFSHPKFSESKGQQVKEKRKKISLSTYAKEFKHRNVFLALIMVILFFAWLFVFTSFAPTYFVDAAHYSTGSMSLIMTAIGLGSFFWGFFVPLISDKFGRKPTLIFFSFVSSLCPIAFVFIHANVTVMMIVGFLTAVGQGCIPLVAVIILSESVSPLLAASVMGLVQLVGEVIGGAIFPSLSGVLADAYGLEATLWVTGAGAFIAAFVAMGLIETAPNRKINPKIKEQATSTL